MRLLVVPSDQSCANLPKVQVRTLGCSQDSSGPLDSSRTGGGPGGRGASGSTVPTVADLRGQGYPCVWIGRPRYSYQTQRPRPSRSVSPPHWAPTADRVDREGPGPRRSGGRPCDGGLPFLALETPDPR